MASTKAPLFGLDASGTIGGAITFSKWRGRTYVRKTVVPANPQSALQTTVRAAVKFLSQIWASLSATIQGHWNDAAQTENITGLNQLTKHNVPRVRTGFGVIQDPTFTAGAVEDAPTGVTATAQIQGVNVVWTDSTGADDWCTWIYASNTTGFTPGPDNLIAIVPAGTETFTETGLTTGTARYYRLGGCETGGTLGTLAAQVTATPL